jgi:hypothetical protein
VGVDEDHPRATETRQTTEEILTSGVSRAYVAGRVDTLKSTRAPKTYVDSQDELYAPASYYPAQDNLLVPLTAKGTASGVATLGSDGKVPQAQVPVLGAGTMRGPWGANQTFGGTTGITPLKIAQWNLGVSGVRGQPLVFMSTSVASTGRAVIEIRIGDNTQTTYAAQTLIGQGYGRSHYLDYQTITVLPVTAALAEGQDGVQDSWHPATNLLINAWLFDTEGGQSTTQVGSVATAALFFARTAL